LFNKSIKQ